MPANAEGMRPTSTHWSLMLIRQSLVPRIQNKLGNPNWAICGPDDKHFLQFVSQPEGSADKHTDQDTLAAGVTKSTAVGLPQAP